MLRQSFILAKQALARQKKRTILTMLSVCIGIAAVITIMAAGKGIRAFVLGQLDVFGTDTLYIETKVPNNKTSGASSVGITITTLKNKDVDSIRRHPNIIAAYGQINGQEVVSYNGEIKKVMLNGKGWDAPDTEKLELSSGRFFSRDEEESLARVAVLGSKVKDSLFGDQIALEKTIMIRGLSFRVVGVAKPRGTAFFLDMDNLIMLPTETMQKKLLGIDYVQGISAKLKNGAQTKMTVEDLAETIRTNHGITDPARDDFAINTTADATASLTTVTGGITFLLLALVSISLIVGGVGIMNIMYVSVAERTFEIGLRKSLGARRGDIMRQFLAEAVLITVGGGVIGIFIGSMLAFLIYLAARSSGLTWIYSVTPGSIALAVGFSVAIGIGFGLYPAKRAAALNPIEALRRE